MFKKLSIGIAIICICLNTFGQDNSVFSKKELKQLTKEKKKAEREAEAERLKQMVDYLVTNKKFVLEANYVSGSSGRRVPVSSHINFIIVDSTECSLQLGSPYGLGYNGVGGITLDGRISKYSLKKIEKKKSTHYNLMIMTYTSAGTYDIILYIDQRGNADATVKGNRAGGLSYHGTLVPLQLSNIYKATSYP